MFLIYREFHADSGTLFSVKSYYAQPLTFNFSVAPHAAVGPNCALIKRRHTRPVELPRTNPRTPPWLPLLEDYPATVRSGRNLYVTPNPGVVKFRLGNMLFNYAATFGIAWRNRRIPLWPEMKKRRHKSYQDIARLFSLRVPIDRNGTISRVSATLDFVLVLIAY